MSTSVNFNSFKVYKFYIVEKYSYMLHTSYENWNIIFRFIINQNNIAAVIIIAIRR
jgi:hypothetical protein